jgi:AcrR family transcriptional regulator
MEDRSGAQISENVDLRQRILQAAESLFADKGYAATSITDITTAAGVARSLIYYYFTDKRDLFFSILKDGDAQILKIANEAYTCEGTTFDRLRVFMTRFSQMLVRRQSLMRIAMRAELNSSPHFDKRGKEGITGVTAILKQIIDEGIAAGELRKIDSEMTSQLIFGMVHTLVFMHLKHMPDSPEADNIEFAVSVLTRGIVDTPCC